MRRQSGAALVVALILLAVITLLGVTSMRTSIMEQKMASNEQLRMEAFQIAQSIVDDVVAEKSHFPVNGTEGYTNCTTGLSDCNAYNITLSGDYAAYPGELSASVERIQPNLTLPPRAIETSLDKFSAAVFQVTGRYDGAAEGLGSAEIVQAYLLLVPKGAQ